LGVAEPSPNQKIITLINNEIPKATYANNVLFFSSCNRKSGNNKSMASVDKEATGEARIIATFLQDPL